MTSYDKKLHKYDKIGDGKTDTRPLKPEYYGQETSRYAPGTLESNDPKTDQPPFKNTSKARYDDEQDEDWP
jgi:hypothetical protein